MKGSKNLNLEIVRGLAAMAVVVCHIADKTPELNFVPKHLINLFSNWGTESVMVFFILSGIVIHSSFENKPRESKEFLIQRIIRLSPTLFLSVFLTVVTSVVAYKKMPDTLIIIGNLIPVATLQGGITSVIPSNPVIWSLSFEVFFYLIFGAFIISGKKINYLNLLIWTLISLINISLYYLEITNVYLIYLNAMFAFSTVWLVGFLAWRLRENFKIHLLEAGFSLGLLPMISRLHLSNEYYDPLKYTIFAFASIPLFIYLIQGNNKLDLKRSRIVIFSQIVMYFVVSYLMFNDIRYSWIIRLGYISFPLITFATFLFTPAELVKRFLKYSLWGDLMVKTGRLSYSIYLFHFPILVLINLLPLNFIVRVLLTLISTVIISYITELKLQPILQKLLQKKPRLKIN